MLKKEHLKQASVEKIARFNRELSTEIINTISEQSGYLNETEKIMSMILVGNTLIGACEEIIGEECVNLILEHIKNVKEKNKNEGTKNNQEEWRSRNI